MLWRATARGRYEKTGQYVAYDDAQHPNAVMAQTTATCVMSLGSIPVACATRPEWAADATSVTSRVAAGLAIANGWNRNTDWLIDAGSTTTSDSHPPGGTFAAGPSPPGQGGPNHVRPTILDRSADRDPADFFCRTVLLTK
jgi:hypothetical protein